MNRLFQTLLLTVPLVIAFVMIGSLAARFIGFSYEALDYLAWAIPVGAGFLATKANPLYMSLIAGVIVEFVRSTLGWVFASAVKVGPQIGDAAFGDAAWTIFVLTLLGAAWGLLGGGLRWLMTFIQQRNAAPPSPKHASTT